MIERRFILPLVIALLALLAFLAWWVPRHFHQATQTRVDRSQVEAGATTGDLAINALESSTAAKAAIDQKVDEGVAAIRAAPEGQKDDVAISVLCGFKSAADKPECKKGAVK